MTLSAHEEDPLPAPQHCAPGGSIRWVVGTPEGPRSQSWSVFGNANSDDVYLGPRAQTGAIKLSLHQSDRWRMAWTDKEHKLRGLSEDFDRVLTRWSPPKEIQPGWRHAVTVLFTAESLAPDVRDKSLRKVPFWPPPNPGGALWLQLVVGASGADELLVRGAFDVGRLLLPGGGLVAVIMRPDGLTEGTASTVAEIRSEMLAVVTAAGARRNTSFSWGTIKNGAVLLVDTGSVEPPGEPTPGSQTAPGRITYVRRVDRRQERSGPTADSNS